MDRLQAAMAVQCRQRNMLFTFKCQCCVPGCVPTAFAPVSSVVSLLCRVHCTWRTQGSAAAEPKGRKLSARQRKQRSYAAMGYGSDDEYAYRCVCVCFVGWGVLTLQFAARHFNRLQLQMTRSPRHTGPLHLAYFSVPVLGQRQNWSMSCAPGSLCLLTGVCRLLVPLHSIHRHLPHAWARLLPALQWLWRLGQLRLRGGGGRGGGACATSPRGQVGPGLPGVWRRW